MGRPTHHRLHAHRVQGVKQRDGGSSRSESAEAGRSVPPKVVLQTVGCRDGVQVAGL